MQTIAIFLALLITAVFSTSLEQSGACTFTSYSAITGVTSCSSITLQGPFTVPANKVIDMSNLATGTTVYIKGTITFAKGTLDSTNYLLTITGTSITIDGTGGTLDGSGPSYWDGKGSNGGVPKPKFFHIKVKTGSLKGIKIVGSPIQTFSLASCSSFTVDGVTIDNRGTNYANGHNTDGFDVSSAATLTIKNSYVYNNDDCLAINSGSDIHFTNNYCWGGHGVSVGSVKTGNTVNGVFVSNTQIVNSDNGVRIKVYNDATSASVNNVNYDTITLSGITKYGIIIQQDYTNSGATGTPGKNAPITNVKLSNIKGTMSAGEAVYVLCGNCASFTFSSISITGSKVASKCTGISPVPGGCNTPAGLTDDETATGMGSSQIVTIVVPCIVAVVILVVIIVIVIRVRRRNNNMEEVV